MKLTQSIWVFSHLLPEALIEKNLADSHCGNREDANVGNPNGSHLVLTVAAVGATKLAPRELISPSTMAPIQTR